MRSFFLWGCFVLIVCGCTKDSYNPYSIGRDPNWIPLQLGMNAVNINGFTNALVQAIAAEQKVNMTLIDTSWPQLFEGLKKKKYGGVFSSLTPNIETRAQYSFSDPFLLLGPVLIVPESSQASSLEELQGKIVGVSQFDDSSLIVQQYSTIIIRLYQNMPVALNDLANGKIDAILLADLEARAWIPNLYSGQLKIVSPPLNDKGLRLLTLKGENDQLIRHFNKGLKKFRATSEYTHLREKFGVASLEALTQ